jgi:hypothetical protein
MWERALILALLVFGIPSLQAQPERNCSACAQIQQALEDFGHLKSGMNRQDVERHFILDGGMNFRGQSYYVYQKCDFIRIEVTFELDASVQNGFSPRDRITKLSKLYLGFPARD